MRIARFFSILLTTIGICVAAFFGNSVKQTIDHYFDVQALNSIAEKRTEWATGTVALSLERSVTQVALALQDPVPAELKAIIENQRDVSNLILNSTLDRVSEEFDGTQGSERFVTDAQALQTVINDLRTEIDSTLSVPLSQRPTNRAHDIPNEMKSGISRLQRLTALLQIESEAKSDDSIALDRIQALAWEIREYGGRARTYFAIATLTGQPLDTGSETAVFIETSRAAEAWTEIQNILTSTTLAPALVSEIELAGNRYFGEYIPLTDAILASSDAIASGAETAYTISFDDYFARSSAALAEFEALVDLVGMNTTSYWQDRLDTALWEVALKAAGLIAMIFGLILVKAIVTKRVTSRVESATNALRRVAEGDLDAKIDVQQRELHEISELNSTLGDLREKLSQAKQANDQQQEQQQQQAIVVARLSNELSKLAEGDLSGQIHETFSGSYDNLRLNFNASLTKLQTILQNVVSTSETIFAGSEQLSSSSENLAMRTEQQAEALAETTATVTQIREAVTDTAKNAANAASMVRASRELAEGGETIVRRTVEAMNEITEGSTQISQIINTIDDIAFQTNLLALNAGVEAARAGDAGRGFSVVASEVGSLAKRAGEAAKEIKTLVEASQAQVLKGSALTNEASDALLKISEQVQQADDKVSEIHNVTQEQATSIAEINIAMTELDKLTQDNAAMVQEATAASAELKSDAQRLQFGAGQFKLAGSADVQNFKEAS